MGLSVPVILLVLGIVGVALDRIFDLTGLSRSSRTLRQENTDLVRRNLELEATVTRHEGTIKTQGEKIAKLEERVALLAERDQTVVLERLQAHDQAARADSHKTIDLLTEIRDGLSERK